MLTAMHRRTSRNISRFGIFAASVIGLAGCSEQRSPALPLFGAYFPSWLFCILAGVIGAVIVRVIFVRIGVDEGMPFRLLVYTCIAAIIGLSLALTVFGR